jgi:predicted N-acetyltransferase YhbS
MFLKLLMCHPDYQRRGAGRALTRWGIKAARDSGLNTTVFASPMGFQLYQKLGFEVVGSCRVQLSGETEFLSIPAMVLEDTNQTSLGEDEDLELYI